MRCKLSAYLFIAFISMKVVSSARICFLPFSVGGSHFMVLKRLAEELEKRGHEITFIVADRYADKKGHIFKHHIYEANIEDEMKSILAMLMEPGSDVRLHKMIPRLSAVNENAARSLLKNQEAMNAIKKSNLLITETMFFTAPLIAEIANIPRIDFLATMMSLIGHVYGIQTPPSYVPNSLTSFTDRMNFPQRMINALITLVMQACFDTFTLWNQHYGLMSELGIPPERSFKDIIRQARAVIIQADFAIEYIQPLPPHIHFVGPILPKPIVNLPNSLESVMQSAGDNGIVIVAFGSYLDSGSVEDWKEMIEGFSRVKQTFIWKTSLKIKDLPSNIKTFDWLPQNDILGHSQTKAFVSHMGHNSAYEGAYHSVPILAVPMVNDQPIVARKMSQRGKMALIINKDTADANEWERSIKEVISNPWYKNNATRVARLLKSKGSTSCERAASIVEQVLAEGPDSHHLFNTGTELSFFELQSFDVMITLIVTLVVMIRLQWMILRKLYSFLCKPSKPRLIKNKKD